jgi:glucose/arabinose dehydrogenase
MGTDLTTGRTARRRATLLAFVGFIVAAAVLMFVAHRFAKKELALHEERQTRPRVVSSRPMPGETGIAPNLALVVSVRLPKEGQKLDPGTLSAESVRLTRVENSESVPMDLELKPTHDPALQLVVATPRQPLLPNQRYELLLSERVTDTNGYRVFPHRARFVTADGQNRPTFPWSFEKVALPEAIDEQPFICVALCPDGKLYASTFDGRIVRFEIRDDGTLRRLDTISTVIDNNAGPRLITGICFDPASSQTNLIAYVSHGQSVLENADDWTGKLSRLSGDSLEKYEDLIVELPRGQKDHLNFQPVVGPDGAIYFGQGSMTSAGDPDPKWGSRGEHLMTAAVLRLDLTKLKSAPLRARTDGANPYDPFAPDAPLTIFATGVRSGFDLLFHSNGSFYATINGAAGGGNAPGSPVGAPGPVVPALREMQTTTDDILVALQQGAYYGHPNPLRKEYVVNAGNARKGFDPQGIPDYPDGQIPPDPRYRLPVYVFGRNLTPSGLVEFGSDALGADLRGAIIVTRFSGYGDLVVLLPNADGAIERALIGIDGLDELDKPLDVAVDPRNGNLYVAEFGGKRITLLKPAPERESRRVFVEDYVPR